MSSNSNKISLLDKAQRWITRPFTPEQVNIYAQSHRATRPENQDNYLVIYPSGQAEYLLDEQKQYETVEWSSDWYRLVVADGMGGHENGRQISEALIKYLQQEKPCDDVEMMRERVYDIHTQLYKQFAHSGGKNAGSTLVWVDVHNSGLVLVATVGDSRLYHAPVEKTWQQKTFDHNAAEFDWRDRVKAGETALKAPDENTNKLAQAMGFGSYGLIADETGFRPRRLSEQLYLELAQDLPEAAQTHADVFSFYLEKGDCLLLASDGVWSGDNRFDFPTAQALSSEEAFSKAVWDCLEKATDNTTAVLWRSL